MKSEENHKVLFKHSVTVIVILKEKKQEERKAMTQSITIKRLKDGSIDHAHYIAISHEIRSKETHQTLSSFKSVLNKVRRTVNRHLLNRSRSGIGHSNEILNAS